MSYGFMKAEETYVPTDAIASNAKKAIQFKEDGKANGAGTNVGWTRAHQLANKENLSLDTVKRMYSYFSRHEVDKQGKNWGSDATPSKGYVMWLAWGGDAGYRWATSIVNREKDKLNKGQQMEDRNRNLNELMAAIAKAKEEVSKREFSDEKRASLAEEGKALPDGSYPIETIADLENAIQSYGRAKDKEAVKAHIEARAKALGAEDKLPESWNA